MPGNHGAGTPTTTYVLSKVSPDDTPSFTVNRQAASVTEAPAATSTAVATFRLNPSAPVKTAEVEANSAAPSQLLPARLGQQQQHILVRTADVSQWLGALQAQARHPWLAAKANQNNGTATLITQRQQRYRWHDRVSSSLIMRGRDGRTLVQRAPPAAPNTADSRPGRPAALPSITTLPPPTDTSDMVRCRSAELGYPRSNPELSVETRMRMSASYHNIPAHDEHDLAEPRPQSVPSTRPRTVSFNTIVLTADFSSRDEYERAGPDMISQYKKLPREERMKVNQEIDRYAHCRVPMRAGGRRKVPDVKVRA